MSLRVVKPGEENEEESGDRGVDGLDHARYSQEREDRADADKRRDCVRGSRFQSFADEGDKCGLELVQDRLREIARFLVEGLSMTVGRQRTTEVIGDVDDYPAPTCLGCRQLHARERVADLAFKIRRVDEHPHSLAA